MGLPEKVDDNDRKIISILSKNARSSLRDIAGVSISASRKGKLFPSEKFLIQCYDQDKPNPVSKNEISTGLKDPVDYITYFDLSKLRSPLSVSRYIHEDILQRGEK